MHEIQLLHQIPVMGREVDLFVEPPVRTGERFGITDQGAIRLHHLAQHAHFFQRRMARGQTRGQPFEFGANNV
ncbi:hypothetical protein GCM10022404_02640 [Celeribacter arenosi]|uniref:Uncharacterized protein n=1 Tax=Celeribacter arenosi TaxID=792649 RepID=A0ABP7JW78_9RHOB